MPRGQNSRSWKGAQTVGEASSIAFIAKKEFTVDVGAEAFVHAPEPNSTLLFGLGIVSLFGVARRRYPG
jgi:hypothetical protein